MFRYALVLLLASSSLACPDELYCRECNNENPAPTCEQCSDAVFDSSKKQCVPVVTKIPHCREFAQVEDKISCTRCNDGYTVNSQQACVQCEVKDCARCDNDKKTCDACLDKKMLQDNTCSEDKFCNDKRCMMCDDKNTCLQCDPFFALDNNNKCIEFKPNCERIDPNREIDCLRCNLGYYVTKDGYCLPNTRAGLNWFAKLLLWLIVLGALAGLAYLAYTKYQRTRVYMNANPTEEYTSVN